MGTNFDNYLSHQGDNSLYFLYKLESIIPWGINVQKNNLSFYDYWLHSIKQYYG